MVPALRRFFASAVAAALLPAWLAAQQPAVITGQVTGEDGRAIANATVSIPQFQIGGTTREDGRYSILVPANRVSGQQVTLTAKAINYKPQSTTITLAEGQITQDFTLAPNPLQLGEVVVTGAGTASEVEKLGNVRNSVPPAEIDRSNEPSVVAALSAKAPNVQVTTTSGSPGASTFIQIRGPRTYNTTGQPIIVVDGLPIDYTSFATFSFNRSDGEGPITGGEEQTRAIDLNPNDIESVEILKGPAASAIYGARAAAGAILITTKSGKPGPTRYSLRSNFQFDRPTKYYPLQRSWAGPGRFGVLGFGIRSWGPAIGPSTPTYDHARELFETGFGTDQTLTISGGNDRTLFYLSGNYNYTDGMIVGSNDALKRVTVRLNGSQRVSDRLKVSGNIAYANTGGRFIQRGNNVSAILLGGLRTPPQFNNLPDTADNGQHRSYNLPDPLPTETRSTRVFDNPFFVIRKFDDRAQTDRVFGNIGAEWQAFDWLKFNYTLGADYYDDERLEGYPLSNSTNPDGQVIGGHITNFQVDHNLSATASWKASEGLAGTVTVGQGLNHRRQTIQGTVGRTLIAPDLFTFQNTVTRDPLTDQVFKNRVEGYFGQVTFDIAKQLYLTGAIRNDGSNTYGVNHRRAWFPKGSAAWNFIPSRPEGAITYGKLRAAYGEAGIEPNPYQIVTVVRSDLPSSGGVQGTGLSPILNGQGGTVLNFIRGNPDLREERSKEFEAGIDLGLVKDKADLSFTWYNSRTSGVILQFPLPPSTGFLFEQRNAGEFRNRGIEVTLNVRPITTKDFGWDLGFQFARNRNKVLNIVGADTSSFIELPGAFLLSQGVQIGQPFGIMRGLGLVKCGITPQVDALVGDTSCDTAPKGALYIAANGFPIQDPNVRNIGDPNYDWTGSARTTFRIKGFQVSSLVDVRNGGVVWNGTRGALLSYGTDAETANRAVCTAPTAGAKKCLAYSGNEHTFGTDFWFIGPVAGPGAGTAVPIGEQWYRQGPANVFVGNDEDMLQDAGFVRLREVSLQYTLDQPWVRRALGFSSIDLRVAGRNLLTSTNYTGLDPETNLGQGEQTRRGVDYFNNPQSRSFVFTVTLNR